jgi:hypothetical protein
MMTAIERALVNLAESHERHTKAIERHTDAIHGFKRALVVYEGRMAGVEQGLGEVTAETADRVLLVLANLEKQRVLPALSGTSPPKKEKGEKTDKFALVDESGVEHFAISAAARARLWAALKYTFMVILPAVMGWIAKAVHHELTNPK